MINILTNFFSRKRQIYKKKNERGKSSTVFSKQHDGVYKIFFLNEAIFKQFFKQCYFFILYESINQNEFKHLP